MRGAWSAPSRIVIISASTWSRDSARRGRVELCDQPVEGVCTLAQHGDALALEVVPPSITDTTPPSSVDERITNALVNGAQPMPIAEIRALCRVRNATLYERLTALTAAGRLVRSAGGYRLAIHR